MVQAQQVSVIVRMCCDGILDLVYDSVGAEQCTKLVEECLLPQLQPSSQWDNFLIVIVELSLLIIPPLTLQRD